MNKFFLFSFLACLFFAACQNTPKTPTENTPSAEQNAVAAAPPPSAESIEQARTSLSQGIQLIESIRKQADELPDGIRKQKAKDLEALYSNLEGLLEKETMMLNELKPADKNAQQFSDSPGLENLSAETLKDYEESAVRYAEDLKRIQAIIEQWKNAPK